MAKRKKKTLLDRCLGLLKGLSRGREREDFNARDLARGTRVEMEHTTSRKIAERIAMDHLTEDPRYYQKLARMERKR